MTLIQAAMLHRKRRAYFNRMFLFSRIILLLALVLPLTGCGQEVSFSPDGKQVVFTWSAGPAYTGLYMAGVDGSKFHAVSGGQNGFSPVWSPNGKHIVFSSLTPTGEGGRTRLELKFYDPESNSVFKAADDAGPPFAWRHDNWRCAAIKHVGDHLHSFLYNYLDRGILFDLPLPVSEVLPFNSSLIWLPNSDIVGLVGDSNVYLLEQGEVHQISTTSDVIGLGLAADGKGLVWARREEQGRRVRLSLYHYDLGGRSATRLDFPDRSLPVGSGPSVTAGDVDYVAFSPDGSRLALVVTLGEPSPGQGYPSSTYQAVYTVGIEGTGARLVEKAIVPKLQKLAAGRPDVQLSGLLTPSWSPDSQQLAVYQAGEGASIHVYDQEGKPTTVRTTFPTVSIRAAAAVKKAASGTSKVVSSRSKVVSSGSKVVSGMSKGESGKSTGTLGAKNGKSGDSGARSQSKPGPAP